MNNNNNINLNDTYNKNKYIISYINDHNLNNHNIFNELTKNIFIDYTSKIIVLSKNLYKSNKIVYKAFDILFNIFDKDINNIFELINNYYKNINVKFSSIKNRNDVKIIYSIFFGLIEFKTLFKEKIYSKIKNKDTLNNYYNTINIFSILCVYPLNIYLYEKQLDFEKKNLKNKDTEIELSKKIFDSNYKNIIYVDKNIQEKEFQISNKSINIGNINLPVLNDNITDNKLSKFFGLCTFELYKLINNNNLKQIDIVKLNNYLSIKNDFQIQVRTSRYYSINETNNLNIESHKKNLLACINSYYLCNISTNEKNSFFFKNPIYNLKYIGINKLKKTLQSSNKRYVQLIGSLLKFKPVLDLSNNISGGHKISLIFDRHTNTVYLYETLGKIIINDTYNLATYKINNFLSVCLKKFFSDNDIFFNNWKFYTPADIDVQNNKFNVLTNIKYSKIINTKHYLNNERYKDWSMGYCGLWNIFISILIEINPSLDIIDILSLYNKLTEEDKLKHIKLFIRSFAYHIENLINNKSNAIPISTYKCDVLLNTLYNNNDYIKEKVITALYFNFKEDNDISIVDIIEKTQIITAIIKNMFKKYGTLQANDLPDVKILKNNITFLNIK